MELEWPAGGRGLHRFPWNGPLEAGAYTGPRGMVRWRLGPTPVPVEWSAGGRGLHRSPWNGLLDARACIGPRGMTRWRHELFSGSSGTVTCYRDRLHRLEIAPTVDITESVSFGFCDHRIVR